MEKIIDHVSEQIRPFTKAGAREIRRGGPKPGRCLVLTDTPEKEEIKTKKIKIKSRHQKKEAIQRKMKHCL